MLDDRAVDMETSVLDCRTSGHFMPYSQSRRTRYRELITMPGAYSASMRNTIHSESECTHCGTVRRRVFDEATGDHIRTTYDYPSGYLVEQGSGRLLRAEAWRVLSDRVDGNIVNAGD